MDEFSKLEVVLAPESQEGEPTSLSPTPPSLLRMYSTVLEASNVFQVTRNPTIMRARGRDGNKTDPQNDSHPRVDCRRLMTMRML